MKNLTLIGLLLLGYSSVKAQSALDTLKTTSADNACFQLTKNAWSNKCGKKASLELEWKNNCSEKYDFKYAVMREGGKWQIGTILGVKPKESVFKDKYVCGATGQIKFWALPSAARPATDWPSDEEIKKSK